MEPTSKLDDERALPRTYRTPPLAEVLCEARFSSATPWDWTVPGLIYGRISADFPTKEEQGLFAMQLQVPGQEAAQVTQQGIGRMRFVNEDRSGFVQVGPNLLVVNRLPPYPGWQGFCDVVVAQLENYLAVARPARLERLTLRYLNKVVIPGGQFRLEDYFWAIPGLPLGLEAELNAFATLSFEGPAQQLSIGFGTTEGGSPTEAHFLMDLEATGEPGTLDSAAIGQWLDTAHQRIELAFDRSFTEQTHREIFGEGPN
jgi:uncharacterized protein (TIGR04255 family)